MNRATDDWPPMADRDKLAAAKVKVGQTPNKLTATSNSDRGTLSMMKKTLQARQSSFSRGPGNAVVKDGGDAASGMKKMAPSKKAVPGKKKAQVVAPTKARATKEPSETSKPTFDKEATKKFDAMLDGDMTDLPPLPKSMVRIFLSSTFTDMRAERNALAREVYPALRQLCAGYDLDFQVVDMRWGVTEDSQNDHSVEKLCILEVLNCRKVSRGPNFVVLSGDRYGFRPIPVEIGVPEFETLRQEATTLGLEGQELLDDWFKLDRNAIPAVYILQEIRSKFTFFGDHSPGCDENRRKDTADWWKTYNTLQSLLRRSADAAYANNTLSAERRHQYYMAVTECEIQAGILNTGDVDGHCLVYKRELRYLNGPALYEENAARYIDVKKTGDVVEVDEEALHLREDLVQNKIPGKLKESAIRSYTVTWQPGGVDPRHADHSSYLNQFCTDFISDVSRLVEGVVRHQGSLIMTTNYYSYHEETIHHLRFCEAKCEAFCGQDQVLNAAKAYILDDNNRKPFIIHAPSGAGKTSIMAMVMKSISQWLNGKDHVKLIRFLGTTPSTINIFDVLFSIVGQLADSGDLIMSPVNYKSMKAIVEFFPRFLRLVSSTLKIPVIILLDSVDQLSSYYKVFDMEWLPTILPPNIKLIISTLPEVHEILDNLKKLLPDSNCYVEVPLLPESTGKTIVETYLKLNKRTLTENQVKLVLSVFRQTPSPLFLKLLLDEASKWHSYTPMVKMLLPSTVKEAINKLFENLENKFGYTLVSHALGYITVGKVGLTEFEIEDVLSCDDKVLNEVYRFHDPPVEGIIRIPPVLWTRIHHDIKEYLVERLSYGKNTLNWYHRQFTETAQARYTSGNKDRHLHKTLTDIYFQDDGVRRTITLTNRSNLTIIDADRQVTPQPYTPKNRRKLACLSYHTMRAYTEIGLDVVKSKVFCNFKFLCTYIAAFSPGKIIEELGEFIHKINDTEVALLLEFLSSCKEDLSQPVRFAFSLLASIQMTDDYIHLKTLLADSKEYLISQADPLLIPTFASLSSRQAIKNALTSSIDGIASVISCGSGSLLLEVTDVGDSQSEYGYVVYDGAGAQSQHVALPRRVPSYPPQLSRTGEYTFYVTQEGLTKLTNTTGHGHTVNLSNIVPDYDEKTDLLQNYFADKGAQFGVLIFERMLVLVDLMNLSFVQKFKMNKELAKVENVIFYGDVKPNPKFLAVCQIHNSITGDSQGPRDPSFVCQFKCGSEDPVSFTETDQIVDGQLSALLAKDSLLLLCTPTNKGDDSETKMHNVFCYQLNPLVPESSIHVTGSVVQIVGNPNIPLAVVMTTDDCAYLLNVEEAEIKLKIKINVPVTHVDVIWEENIAILGSVTGSVTLYDMKNDKYLGAFPAHDTAIEYIAIVEDQLVTLDKEHDMKSWSLVALVDGISGNKENTDQERQPTQTLFDEVRTISLGVSPSGDEVITATDEGHIKVWSVENQRLLRSFHISVKPDVMQVTCGGEIVLLDHSQDKLVVLDSYTGEDIFTEIPPNVACFTVNSDGTCIYAVSSPKKGVVHVHLLNLKVKKIAKTVVLQKGFTYVSLTGILSETGRFLVLRSEVTDDEYKTISAMWKKIGSYPVQPHRHRFTALDMSQATGGLMPCFRQQTKIPVLGVALSPYQGNTVMVTTRRSVMFWDIPTGKCDQKPCRTEKVGMMYRPEWLGQQCKGANVALVLSPNKEFVVTGSEDGYLFIYSSEIGIPRGRTKPATKHSAELTQVAVSPDSQWVASTCRNCILKLWDSRSGHEIFSVNLTSEVQVHVRTFSPDSTSEVRGMMFSPDSRHLVLYTGAQTTRVHVFAVHAGKTS